MAVTPACHPGREVKRCNLFNYNYIYQSFSQRAAWQMGSEEGRAAG